MKKEEFLKKLKRKLAILQDSEIRDILDEYEGYINEKMKKKKISEEDAIAEFGDIDELASEILSAYKINSDSERAKNSFMGFFETIGDEISDFVDSLQHMDGANVAKIVIEIVVALILVGLCRIPVELLIDLGRGILHILPDVLFGVLYGIWRFIIEIAYVVVAIVFLVKYFKTRFASIKVEKKDEDIVVKEAKPENKKTVKPEKVKVEAKKEEVKEEPRRAEKEPKESEDILSKILLGFVKFICIFIAIIAISSLVGLCIAFAIGVAFVTQGVFYFGILAILASLIIFNSMIVGALFNFISNARVKGSSIFASIIVAIVFMAVGVSMTVIEVSNTTFVNAAPEEYVTKTAEYTYNASEVSSISSWSHITYQTVDNLNEVIVEITYYDKIVEPVVKEFNGRIDVDYAMVNSISGKDVYNLILESFKDKTIYNYTLLNDVEIKVTASAEIINKLRQNSNHYYEEDDYEDLIEERDYWKDKYYSVIENSFD